MTLKPTHTFHPKSIAQLAVVMLAAAVMKWYYSAASVNYLHWILWPTTKLTELVTGRSFAFESNAGYLSDDRTFLIAASCSGVNFLITLFLLLTLRRLWLDRTAGTTWHKLPAILLFAYLTTIVANTVRIAIAMWLNAVRPNLFGLDRDELHRIEGILVYFGFLFFVFVFVNKRRGRMAQATNDRAYFAAFATLREASYSRRVAEYAKKNDCVRYLFPLAIYYMTALVIPVINGAFLRADFWKHALFVIGVPLVLIAAAAATGSFLRLYRKRKQIAAVASRLPLDTRADDICPRANVGNAAALS